MKGIFEDMQSDINSKILVARDPRITAALVTFLLGGISILFSIETINAVVSNNAISSLGFLLIYSYVLTGYLFAGKIAPYSFLSFLSISKEFLEERLIAGDG